MIGQRIVHCSKNIAMRKINAAQISLFGYILTWLGPKWL